MAQKIGDAFVEISARLDKFKKQIDGASHRVNKSFSGVGKKLDSVFSGLGGVIAGAFAVQKIAAFTAEAVKLASVAEGVKVAFDRLNDPMLLANLQKATRGTVSELDLMKQAVQAKNLGVPIENLASLFAFATQRAADTGEEVSHLVQSITVGIGRKSSLILDNLGISAIALKEALGGVGLETASVGDIAEAVGKIASQSMADIGDTALTSAQKIAIMTADIQNMKIEIGKNLLPLWDNVLSVITQIVRNGKILFSDDSVMAAAAEFTDLSLSLEKANEAFEYQIGLEKQGITTREETISGIAKYIDSLKKQIAETSEAYKTQKEYANNLNQNKGVIDAWWASSEKSAKILVELQAELSQAESNLNAYTRAALLTTKANESISKSFDKAAYDAAVLKSALSQDMSRGGSETPTEWQVVPEFLEEGEFENWDANLQALAESQARLNQQVGFGSNIAMGFGQAMSDSLSNALNGAGNFFQMMGEYLKQLVIRLTAAAITAFALQTILGGLTGGASILGNLGGFGGLFSQFAGGGGFGGGSKIYGRDIELSNSRTQRLNSRTTGIGG